MIDKVDSNQFRDVIERRASQFAETAKPSKASPADLSLQADFASLIKAAGRQSDDDAAAVEKARELLASGQLDTAENIRAAAENIVDYGV